MVVRNVIRANFTRQLLLATALSMVAVPLMTGQEQVKRFAQSPASTPYVPTMTFDIASIHEAQEADSYTVGGGLEPHSSTLRLQNFRIENLLSMAYAVKWHQMSNLPNWPYPAMFTVAAKSDWAADEKLAKLNDADALSEKRHMLQMLLADRFHLQLHEEDRDGPAYNLVVAKGGPRLALAGSAPPSADELTRFGNHSIPALYQRNDGQGYDYVAHGANMKDIVSMLTGQLGRRVIDKTGLAGKYDFVLQYRGAKEAERPADDTDPTPPLERAIQSTLGLKLEPARASIHVLVIDHIEKPSEN
jgi:uncharacterized protein (TIGR03435 family)